MKYLTYLLLLLLLPSCMKESPIGREQLSLGQKGVYIVCEGNFRYGNASLAHYSPTDRETQRFVFRRANGRALGDVAQSMNIYNNEAYIVVNYSGVIYITNPHTGALLGGIKGFKSPRYIQFLSPHKAYVTDLEAEAIQIVDPTNRKIIGQIPTPGHRSTEQMTQIGSEVFVSCWSYDNKILVVDSGSDQLVDSITVGIQPLSITKDRAGKLWVLCTGGYEGSTYGHEPPSLWRIDAQSRHIEQVYHFQMNDKVTKIATNPAGDSLYFVRNDLYKMSVDAIALPTERFAPSPKGQSIYYGLGVDPHRGDVYVADAIDYQQAGLVYRYSSSGHPLDTFKVGIIPGSFCFQ